MLARRSSIRFKILLPLLVPLLSLTALWVFAAATTLGDGLELRHVRTISDHFGYPAGALNSALQQERRMSLTYLGGRAPDARASLESQRIRTDQQADLFRNLATDPDARDVAGSATLSRADDALGRLASLKKLRAAVDGQRVDRGHAYATYTGLIGSLNSVQSSLTTLTNPGVARESHSVVALTEAREALSQENGVISGVLAKGRMTQGQHTKLTQLIGAQRRGYESASADLTGSDRAYYDHITGTETYQRLRTMENKISNQARPGQPIPMNPVQWKVTSDSVLNQMRGLELAANARVNVLAAPVAQNIIWRIVGAGVLGLLALVASIWLSVRAAGSVVRELRALRDSALELANERLPSLVDRLRRNADVDTAAEAPPLSFGTQEIDAVGSAFNAARRTAIESAVGEAKLRRGISEIFVNLARRSQTLIHRQLSLLDTMENRITDPEELQDLFRIDHLSTRMRRHAEGLIILSGSAPGRGWRNPVPIVDVVRGAASEVEDYARVKVQAMPSVALAGAAVADMIHLLAELIENSTQFSPPHTPVRVVGQIVGNGFVVEIEDRGLSMTTETLETANRMLSDPPPFDLINSARLGHFVVARLAARHDIKVSLRTSPYGGTTAIVLIPSALIVDGDQAVEPDSSAMNGHLVSVNSGEPHANGSGDATAAMEVPRPMHRPLPPDPLPGQPSDPLPDPLPEPSSFGPVPSTPEALTGDLPFPRVPAGRPEPEPGGRSGRPAEPGPGSGVPDAPPPSMTHRPGGKTDDGRPKLPRRVPQTSISPELLERTNNEEESGDDRSPDEVRTILSSIQRGWQRGRSEAGTGDHPIHPAQDEEQDR